MNCIFCKKEVEPMFMDLMEASNVNEMCWNDAIVGSIRAGYGSKFDNDDFIICICDECIEQHLQDQIK